MRSYKVALGGEPVGPKAQPSDQERRRGLYLLEARNSHSHFYKAFHISYPNSKDIAAARRMGVRPGGDIMLHGLAEDYAWMGKTHLLHDWTDAWP